jgi:uncharacterized delta-60 repeat protein
MQQETTRYQWMISSARRLQAGMRRGGGVGVLAVLLLLPLTAAGQAPLEALAPLKSDAEVEALGAVALGDLDTSFGSTGKVLTVFFDGSAASAVAIQSDGKIVVAGSALVRYNADGTLDTTFGDQGKVTTFCCGALAIQPDGKIVGAGVSGVSPGNVDFALVRYLPNGTLDTTFSGDGTVTTDFGNGRLDGAWAIVLQPDGKIVVVGASRVEGDSASEDVALARYLPNGSLDATFSGDGKVLTDLGSGEGDVATAVALQPDGKIVVAGFTHRGDFALARYLSNGTLDTTFRAMAKSSPTSGVTALTRP